MTSRRLAVLSVAMLALFAAPGAAIAGPRRASATDTFSGRIIAATGRLRGDRGRLTVRFSVHGSGTGTHPLTLTLVGEPCGRAKRCIDLSGRLTGTIRTPLPKPDRGTVSTVIAAGIVKPLGRTSLTGTAVGTGFIATGEEQLRLTLTGHHGRLEIVGLSAPVPGFSSP